MKLFINTVNFKFIWLIPNDLLLGIINHKSSFPIGEIMIGDTGPQPTWGTGQAPTIPGGCVHIYKLHKVRVQGTVLIHATRRHRRKGNYSYLSRRCPIRIIVVNVMHKYEISPVNGSILTNDACWSLYSDLQTLILYTRWLRSAGGRLYTRLNFWDGSYLSD